MISAIKKIAVSGACNTPAIKPDIPIKVKLASETETPKPELLIILANRFPKELPITKVGIMIPPVPPAASVVVMAIALKTVMPKSSKITTQILSI